LSVSNMSAGYEDDRTVTSTCEKDKQLSTKQNTTQKTKHRNSLKTGDELRCFGRESSP